MLLSRGLPGRQACVALCQVRRDHAARVGLVHPALLEGCQQALPHASLLTSYQRPHAPKVATTARAETAAPAIASATPATDRTDTDARAKGTTAATAHSARRRAERGAGEPGNVFRLRAWQTATKQRGSLRTSRGRSSCNHVHAFRHVHFLLKSTVGGAEIWASLATAKLALGW